MKNRKNLSEKCKLIGSIFTFISRYIMLPICLIDLLECVVNFMIKNGNIASLPELIRITFYPVAILMIILKIPEFFQSYIRSTKGDAEPMMTAVLFRKDELELKKGDIIELVVDTAFYKKGTKAHFIKRSEHNPNKAVIVWTGEEALYKEFGDADVYPIRLFKKSVSY